MSNIEKFEVRNRWTNAVQFTAEIEVKPDMLPRVKLGLAVRWAKRSDAVLRGAYLRDADLSGADLRGADLSGAYLRDAYLRDADLSGADLSGAYLRDAYLRDADLSGAYLRGAYLRDAVLRDADLSGADLSGADLRGADLSGAYLRDADLSGAYLRDADLRDAYLRDADLPPVKIENIHQTVYAAASQEGALDMESWHCGTAHCRAGWVVTLAGEGGKALEWAMGTPAAAAMIYLASDPQIERIPDFYCGNTEALADMKRLAEQEAAQ